MIDALRRLKRHLVSVKLVSRRVALASRVLSFRKPCISVEGNPLQTRQPLEPLPFHLQIRGFLLREEAGI